MVLMSSPRKIKEPPPAVVIAPASERGTPADRSRAIDYAAALEGPLRFL
jgi:hypothetical protein